MYYYIVRRLGEARTAYQADPSIIATSHRDAVVRSLLAEPGARLIVEGAGAIVRYHIDQLGRIYEQSRYTT